MEKKIPILYIHGMGGGEDSRIPRLLQEALDERVPGRVDVVVRCYDFDPEKGRAQIASWMEEIRPPLVVGESLGSVHALAIKGVPHLLVSPSLGAPRRLGFIGWLSLIPGLTALFDRIWEPLPGRRQPLHFSWRILHKWPRFRQPMLDNSPRRGGKDYFHAFIGTRDHYRRNGVVSLRKWLKYYGKDSCTVYEGTHFMEDSYVRTLLRDAVLKQLPLD